MPKTDRTAARRLILRRLLERRRVAHQAELLELLEQEGHRVSQATVSRDLAALGARKEDDGRYRLSADGDDTEADVAQLAHRLREFARDISASANLVVVRTPPGAAHAVAVAMDAASGPDGRLDQLLGCVAGDDTLIAVTRSPKGGAALARELRALMEGAR